MSELVFQHCPLRVDEIPAGWELTALSAFVTEVQTGFASGDHNSDGQGVPHLRPMNITPNGAIDLTDLRSVAPEANTLRLRRGDILFNNTNSPVWVGKTAYIDTDIELAFSNHMTRIRAPEEIDARFLAKQIHFLCTSGYFQYQCKKHVNQASINRSFLAESTPFVLPPPGEQRRITTKIEALQERIRKAREALAEVGPLLERFRQSLLAAAYRGDLTAEWRAANPNVEPASELLNRIRQERRQKWEQSELAKYVGTGKQPPKGWQNRYSEPAPVHADELNILNDQSLPDGWIWAPAELIVAPDSDIVYGIVQPGTPLEKGVPYVRGKDIVDGKILVDQLLKTSQSIAVKYERASLKGGDILLGIIRATKVAIVPDVLDGANITQGTARFRPSSIIRTKYLAGWLDSPFAQNWLHAHYRGIDMPGLNLRDVRRLPVPIAPLAEQEALEMKIELSNAMHSSATTQVAESAKALTKLDQSILAKAFRGELVPQDPNDEPASVMLERIRKSREREKRSPKKKDKKQSVTMSGTQIDRLTKWIEETDRPSFSFDQIAKDIAIDYDELKEAIFHMLDSQTLIEQYFDNEAKSIRFRKVSHEAT